MTDLLGQILRLNALGSRAVVEPFAGGAGAALSLLFAEATPRIHLNDADPAIHAFWWSLLHRTDALLEMIDETPLNIAEWRRQLGIYRSSPPAARLDRGFAAFFLNRCNRSGIIVNGGPIGGAEQAGNWRLDARFSRESLRRRCARVAEYSARITLSSRDAVAEVHRWDDPGNFLFIDPPYYHKGNLLYLNAMDARDHAALAKRLKCMKWAKWVLTYDDCPEVRALYADWAAIHPFGVGYSARSRRTGKEVLVAPHDLELPAAQTSAAILWGPAAFSHVDDRGCGSNLSPGRS